jgi:hypothetical protein
MTYKNTWKMWKPCGSQNPLYIRVIAQFPHPHIFFPKFSGN